MSPGPQLLASPATAVVVGLVALPAPPAEVVELVVLPAPPAMVVEMLPVLPAAERLKGCWFLPFSPQKISVGWACNSSPSGSSDGSDGSSPAGSRDGSDGSSPSGSQDDSDSSSPSGSSDGSDGSSPAGSRDGSDGSSPSGSQDDSDSSSPSGSRDGRNSSSPFGSRDGSDGSSHSGMPNSSINSSQLATCNNSSSPTVPARPRRFLHSPPRLHGTSHSLVRATHSISPQGAAGGCVPEVGTSKAPWRCFGLPDIPTSGAPPGHTTCT
ncbi:UNVERIFIED_CONTAM: hypothetical protein FKN15_060525 [Acipenser sinensis]